MASILLADNGASSGSAGLKSSADSSGQLVLQTTTSGGVATTAVTIDNSQNVGVGATPSAWGSAYAGKVIQIGNSAITSYTDNRIQLLQNAYVNSSGNFIYQANGYSLLYALGASSGQHTWYNSASGTAGGTVSYTQAMTLDASGSLLVGTTTAPESFTTKIASVFNGGGTALYAYNASTAADSSFVSKVANTSCSLGYWLYNSTNVGKITTNGTGTTYGTSSDYRLKKNVQRMTGALAKVAILNPVTYTWKTDDSDGQGFIAHELQIVFPDAVQGEKDAVDADGNPIYQGIDTSFLVATLTAAIQELNAKVDAQAAEIAVLKGN
jgi:hypothetical protein